MADRRHVCMLVYVAIHIQNIQTDTEHTRKCQIRSLDSSESVHAGTKVTSQKCEGFRCAKTPVGEWLGLVSDEGRGKLRYAWGRCMRPLIPGFPNETSLYTPLLALGRANCPKWSIWVGRGGEIKRDSVSSGERKRKSLNWICYGNMVEMWCVIAYRILLL